MDGRSILKLDAIINFNDEITQTGKEKNNNKAKTQTVLYILEIHLTAAWEANGSQNKFRLGLLASVVNPVHSDMILRHIWLPVTHLVAFSTISTTNQWMLSTGTSPI